MSAAPSTDLVGFVQALFRCSSEDAASICRRANERRFAVRSIIVKQGDRPISTFLLVSGRAHALLYGAEGQMILLHEYESGDFFGAIAQTDDGLEECDIVAAELVRAAVFLARDFLLLIQTHACVGMAVSRALLKRLRATATKYFEQSTISAAGRVHAELLRLARLGDGRSIRPIPVLTELALRVQSTRETVSRTISALERRGIVRRDEGALVVVAPHRLEELII